MALLYLVPDGTLTMHTSGGNSRNTFNGKLTVQGRRVEMVGLLSGYEEIGVAGEPGMGVGYFRAEKLAQ